MTKAANPFSGQTSVNRWLANIPSQNTQRGYIYALRKYVTYTGSNPDTLIEQALKSGEDAHDLLKMFYGSINLSSGTKMTLYQAIRSFYVANRIVLGRKPRTFRASVEYEPRKLYTQDEVAMLVDASAEVRDKALITFLAQTGQRIGVVTSLRMRHIDLDQSTPIIVEVPSVLRNKHGVNVNKTQRQYFFAVGEDSRVYLGLMVDDRVRRGEDLNQDSWLFRSHSTWIGEKDIRKVSRSVSGDPLSAARAGRIVRGAAERRGIQRNYGKRYLFHPHGFRRYWKHQLRMGGVDPDLLDFMMGHVLPYGGAYDRWTLDDVRGQYRRAENYLCLRPVYGVSRDDVRAEVLKLLLGKIDESEIDSLSENLGIPPAQILSLVKRSLMDEQTR